MEEAKKLAIGKDYISDFCKKYDYPVEATDTLYAAYELLRDNEGFISLLDDFYLDETINVDKEGGPLDEACKNENVPFFTAKLLFYICLTKSLRSQYEKAGISKEIYFDTVEDLRYKMMECHEVHGIWGVFSPGWYNPVFRMKTFALGRLDYNLGQYNGDDVVVAGRTIRRGDKVLNIHIPSSGKPFNREARLASYELAYRFFKDRLGNEYPVIKCESWLLYGPNREILGEKSNIVSFMDDFKLFVSREYPDNPNMWRIFGARADLPVTELPRDTTLRRAFADWLQKGNWLGAGMGMFIYDPVNKTTLK